MNTPLAQTRSVSRRELLALSLAAGTAMGLAEPLAAQTSPKNSADPRRSSPKLYKMRKSINLWAFPIRNG